MMQWMANVAKCVAWSACIIRRTFTVLGPRDMCSDCYCEYRADPGDGGLFQSARRISPRDQQQVSQPCVRPSTN